jgi:hypothetical protein
VSEIRPTFSGEFQLAGWSESHNGGCKVTFWLADSSDLDAFRAMTVRKGQQAGHRLAAVLVEIGDDEQPVQPNTAMGSNTATVDDHGKHYAILYKSGWFHNPRVILAFNVDKSWAPDDRIEAIKSEIYEVAGVDSLAKIAPDDFLTLCDEFGIRATLPAAFGGAA